MNEPKIEVGKIYYLWPNIDYTNFYKFLKNDEDPGYIGEFAIYSENQTPILIHRYATDNIVEGSVVGGGESWNFNVGMFALGHSRCETKMQKMLRLF